VTISTPPTLSVGAQGSAALNPSLGGFVSAISDTGIPVMHTTAFSRRICRDTAKGPGLSEMYQEELVNLWTREVVENGGKGAPGIFSFA
jgi:hypothetical protein